MNKDLYQKIKTKYPEVDIVMASKYLTTLADFKPFLEAELYDFGENRDDAFTEKRDLLKDYPIKWHFIGTLQTKKVKKVINDIAILHSLDRLKLAYEIDKRRTSPLPCYLQVNVSRESQKHGFYPDELPNVIKKINALPNIQLVGLMGMAEETTEEMVIRSQFQLLKELRDKYQHEVPSLTGLSMGMSQDYHIALEVGTTVLRLGRILLNGGTVWEGKKNPHMTV